MLLCNVWDQRKKLFAQGIALEQMAQELSSKAESLWEEYGNASTAVGRKFQAQAEKLQASADTLLAAAHTLYAEGDVAWFAAVIETYGDVDVSSNGKWCLVDGKHKFE